MLVTGANFVPGLTSVDFVRPDGSLESRIAQRALAVTADGTQLGLCMKVGVMTDLPEGQTAALSLRVTTPAGTATTHFGVIGHDELDVTTGARTVAQPGVFSRMDVSPGATLNIANTVPPITMSVMSVHTFDRVWIREAVSSLRPPPACVERRVTSASVLALVAQEAPAPVPPV